MKSATITLTFLAACSAIENPDFMPDSTNLPELRLRLDAPVLNTEDYVTADVNGLKAQVKGHGNSTWQWPKKPYKIKLDEKAELLGLPAGKDWILLANYADKSQLRTAVAFALSTASALTYTPASRFVELFINDKYMGLYQLTEQIKVAKNRVDLSDEGFLLEIEGPTDEHVYIETIGQISLAIDAPDPPTPDQAQSVQHDIQVMEDACGSDAAEDLLDYDAAIAWYWVNELMKNPEAILFRSVYIQKEKNEPFRFGPVWDFDLSAGNINNAEEQPPEGYWIRESLWFKKLFANAAFRERANAAFAALPDTDAIVDAAAAQIALGASNNFQRWLILDKKVQSNHHALGTWEAEVDFLKQWLRARKLFLSGS